MNLYWGLLIINVLAAIIALPVFFSSRKFASQEKLESSKKRKKVIQITREIKEKTKNLRDALDEITELHENIEHLINKEFFVKVRMNALKDFVLEYQKRPFRSSDMERIADFWRIYLELEKMVSKSKK